MKPLSRTTCFKVLNKCAASMRKSQQGLDSMKVDGINGFQKLKQILESCWKIFTISHAEWLLLQLFEVYI